MPIKYFLFSRKRSEQNQIQPRRERRQRGSRTKCVHHVSGRLVRNKFKACFEKTKRERERGSDRAGAGLWQEERVGGGSAAEDAHKMLTSNESNSVFLPCSLCQLLVLALLLLHMLPSLSLFFLLSLSLSLSAFETDCICDCDCIKIRYK